MTTIAEPTAGRSRLLPPAAALVHVLAVGTALGAYALIGRPGPPDLTEHDRFGWAVAAGLATGALLTLATAPAVPRALRLRYLAATGAGLLPSFTLAVYGPVILGLTFLGEAARIGAAPVLAARVLATLVLAAGAGAAAGHLARTLRGPAGPVVLAILGLVGLFGVWTATSLWQ